MSRSIPFSLPYGEGAVEVALPEEGTLRIEQAEAPRPELAAEAVGATLANPVGSPPLEALAGPTSYVAVSVPDSTRVAGTRRYLPALVEALERAGVPDGHVTFLVALGLHRPAGEMEKLRILGPEIFERFHSQNHAPADPEELVALGTTSRGTPVSVNRRAAEADLVLSTSAINFHFHAGFSGGPKGVVPGLAGEETIRANHLLSLAGEHGWHPGCRPGRIEGNPVAQDLREAVSLLENTVFLANTLVDTQGRVFDFVAGHLTEAHDLGCARYRRRFGVPLDAPVDAAVVSAGGRPRDMNLIQAHKALAHAGGVLRPGGVLVLVAECPEGYGHPDLAHWFPFRSSEDILAETRTFRGKYPQTAFALLDEARRFRLWLVTGLPRADVEAFGAEKVEAAEVGPRLRETLGPGARVLASRQGSTLLPFLEEAGASQDHGPKEAP